MCHHDWPWSSTTMIMMIIDHDHHDGHHDHLDDDQPVMARGVVPLSIDDCHARLLSLGKLESKLQLASSSSSFPSSKSWCWSDQSALWSESIRLRLPLVSCLCPLVHSNHLCFHHYHDHETYDDNENDSGDLDGLHAWWWWWFWDWLTLTPSGLRPIGRLVGSIWNNVMVIIIIMLFTMIIMVIVFIMQNLSVAPWQGLRPRTIRWCSAACNDPHRTRSPEQIFDKLIYYTNICKNMWNCFQISPRHHKACRRSRSRWCRRRPWSSSRGSTPPRTQRRQDPCNASCTEKSCFYFRGFSLPWVIMIQSKPVLLDPKGRKRRVNLPAVVPCSEPIPFSFLQHLIMLWWWKFENCDNRDCMLIMASLTIRITCSLLCQLNQ